MYFVYVLFSEKFDKMYVGFSSDVYKRLEAHNDSRNTSWTAKYKPWKIIYTEEFENKASALIREKQLKSSRGRNFIHEFIKH